MPKTYFITNDLGSGRENKPSSTYCYIAGNIGQARYKGEDDNTSVHSWWQYSTDPDNRDALLQAKSEGKKFIVSVGTVGDETITIKQVGTTTTYELVRPTNGKRTVELKPVENDEFKIAHFGHWICPDSEYRSSDTPKTFEEAKQACGNEYDRL